MAVIKGHGRHAKDLRGAIEGAEIAWVAPDFPTAQNIWDQLKTACKDGWQAKSEVRRRVDFFGAGSVTVLSAESLNRGRGFDGMVIDEAAFIDPEVWHSVLRPSLADRQGWDMKISTPNGFNWFHDCFLEAQQVFGRERWQRPSYDNPMMTQEECDRVLSDIGPRRYAQEILAQFTEMEGAEWPGAFFMPSIWFDEWPDDNRHRVMACDPSKGKTEKADPSAWILMQLDSEGVMYVDASIEVRDTGKIVDDGLDFYRWFQPAAVGIEAVANQFLLCEIFRERGIAEQLYPPLIEIDHKSVSKPVRIRRLTPYLSRGEIRFKRNSPGARTLVQQLQAFPIPGNHDDGPDALEMAVRLMRELYEGGFKAQHLYEAGLIA